MDVHVGDLVRVRAAPGVDPHLWDRTGSVLQVPDPHHVVVELETGEDCTLFPEQLFFVGDGTEPLLSPFDIFPGPRPRDPGHP